MTFRLTESVTRQLSVFNGAWRLYLPGFSTDSSRTDHPLILWDRMNEAGGVARATERFLRVSAEASQTAGGGDQAPSYADLEREAARIAARRGGLMSFLRRSIWRGPNGLRSFANPRPRPLLRPLLCPRPLLHHSRRDRRAVSGRPGRRPAPARGGMNGSRSVLSRPRRSGTRP